MDSKQLSFDQCVWSRGDHLCEGLLDKLNLVTSVNGGYSRSNEQLHINHLKVLPRFHSRRFWRTRFHRPVCKGRSHRRLHLATPRACRRWVCRRQRDWPPSSCARRCSERVTTTREAWWVKLCTTDRWTHKTPFIVIIFCYHRVQRIIRQLQARSVP